MAKLMAKIMAKYPDPLAAVGALIVGAFEYVRDLDVVQVREESPAATAHYRIRHPLPNHTLQLHSTSLPDGDRPPATRCKAPKLTLRRASEPVIKGPVGVTTSDGPSLQRVRRFRARLEQLREPGTLRLLDSQDTDTERRRHG